MDTDVLDQTQYCIDEMKKRNVHNFEETLKNGVLSVTPSKLEFTFDFEHFKVQEKTIEIANYYSKPCPIQFVPLETHYFKIKNVARRMWLNPGSVFKMHILFTPNENRDYNDILKIQYFNDQLIQIKIVAKMTTKFSFPTTVNFGNVPLGRTAYYKIPIYSHAEKDFSFAILPSNGEPCVDIYPRWGHIRSKQKPVIIKVIYRPLRYISMNFQVRIFISDLCKTPHVIHFYAYTRPGLLRETLENVKPEIESKLQQKRIGAIFCKEVKSTSEKKDKPKYYLKESIMKCSNFDKVLLKQCNFPLYSLHAVNCILNSKLRKSFNEYELMGPLGVFIIKSVEQRTEKLKKFLVRVDDHYRLNELAKFHYKPKVNYGTFDLNENQIIEIKMQREQAWDGYKDLIINSGKHEFERQKTKKIRQRILRVSQKYPNSFSTSSRKEDSILHYYKILPFLQVARKIVLKNRLLRILRKLQEVTPEVINQFEEPFVENHSLILQA